MSIYRPSPTRRALLGVLILASVSVLTLDFRSSGSAFRGARGSVGAVLAPFQKTSAAVIRPFSSFFSGLAQVGSLRAENERLREENAGLRTRNEELGRAAAQVEDLKKLNNVAIPKGVTSVGARVFVRSPSSFEWVVELDVGSSQGVATGNPVVSGDGLVGKVISVRPTTSVVQLVNDPKFAAGARLEKSREIGSVVGHGAAPLTLEDVDPQVPIAEGERVQTAGVASSGFPPDILIGYVRGAPPPSASLQRTVFVEPATKTTRLEFVKVLLSS